MDKITIERIKTFHPDLREALLKDYLECNNLLPKGVRLRFSYVYRSPKEQEELFKKIPKVTNAKGWQSIHQYGLAYDVVVLLDKDNNGTFESVDWNANSVFYKIVVDFLKSKGYEWGGDWANFKDYPHFQKVFGFGNWKHWKAKIDAGDVIKDTNGITYPKLK